jgi:hypothetical protein
MPFDDNSRASFDDLLMLSVYRTERSAKDLFSWK